MNCPNPTVYIVDDDPAVLESIARLMRSAGLQVRTFDSPNLFLERLRPDAHGCIVLDISMPNLDGLRLQQELMASGRSLPIIFLTGYGEIALSVRAMQQGAANFLTKPVDGDDLIAAVHDAIALDHKTRQARIEVAEINRRLVTLTSREREVLTHVISGRLNKQTASELGTCEKTIKVHRARVMEKLDVTSLAELVHLADKVHMEFMSTHDREESARIQA